MSLARAAHRLRTTGLLLLPALLVGALGARSVQNTDGQHGVQLLRRAQEAMGGAASLSAVVDTTHVLDIVLQPEAGGYTMTQVSQYVAPNHFRQEQETPGGRVVVYSNGTTGWVNTSNGTIPLPPDILDAARGVLFRQTTALILSDRDPQRAVQAVGEHLVEVSGDGQRVRIEFDPQTGLPREQSYAITTASGDRITRREVFSDWREVHGVSFPFRAVQFEDDVKILELTVSEYRVNTGLTPRDLARP